MVVAAGEALAGVLLVFGAVASALAALAALGWWLRRAQGVGTGGVEAPGAASAGARPPRPASAEEVEALVRAHASSRLLTLREPERARWAERRDALSRELGDPVPRGSTLGLVWRQTMHPLAALRYELQDGPAWLVSRYGDEERRLVDAYAEAHVDVLRALARRRGEAE